jgi:hypothetical protein
MSLRKYLLLRLIYLVVIAIGAIVLYCLVPHEVWAVIRATYFSGDPNSLP